MPVAAPPGAGPVDLGARISVIANAWAQRCVEVGAPPSVLLTDDDLAALVDDERHFLLRVGCASP